MKSNRTYQNRMLREQKVSIQYIHRLRPNFEIGSLVGGNK